MLRGTALTLGDNKEYTFAPLTLGALEDYADKLVVFDSAELSRESAATLIDIAFSSLKRNYPDMTREQVRDLIDLGHMGPVLAAVMDSSGIVEKAPDSGEAKGATRKPRRS